MTRKILNHTPTGTSQMYGGEDLDYVNQLLTGANQTTADPVLIRTLMKFRSGKLQVATSSDANKKYSLAASSIAANRTITVPNIGGDRAFVLANAVQTIPNKTLLRSTASDTNHYPDCFSMYHLAKRRSTCYTGGAMTSNFGFGVGAVTGSAQSLTFTSTNLGRYSSAQTTAVSGNQCGQRGNAAQIAVCRAIRARMLGKVRFPSTTGITSMRFYFGLVSTSSAFVTGTDPLGTPGTLEGYMIGYRSDTPDTNFQVFRNDNAGASVVSDTGVAVAADTIYNIELKATETGTPKFEWSINGSTLAAHTTDIPQSTTALYPQVLVETLTGSTRAMHLFYWILETIDP